MDKHNHPTCTVYIKGSKPYSPCGKRAVYAVTLKNTGLQYSRINRDYEVYYRCEKHLQQITEVAERNGYELNIKYIGEGRAE